MQNLFLFGLLVILLLAAQFASVKTVEEVIEKYINKIGGDNRLSALESLYLEGEGHIMQQEVSITVLQENGSRSHTKIRAKDDHNPAEPGGIELSTSSLQLQPGAAGILQVAGSSTETDIAGPLHDYRSKGYQAELLGKEVIESNHCYKIKLSKPGAEMLFWIDIDTYLIHQSTIPPPGLLYAENSQTYTVYTNYKAIDEIWFAHDFEIKSINSKFANPLAAISFYIIQVNPSINPAMYQSE